MMTTHPGWFYPIFLSVSDISDTVDILGAVAFLCIFVLINLLGLPFYHCVRSLKPNSAVKKIDSMLYGFFVLALAVWIVFKKYHAPLDNPGMLNTLWLLILLYYAGITFVIWAVCCLLVPTLRKLPGWAKRVKETFRKKKATRPPQKIGKKQPFWKQDARRSDDSFKENNGEHEQKEVTK